MAIGIKLLPETIPGFRHDNPKMLFRTKPGFTLPDSFLAGFTIALRFQNDFETGPACFASGKRTNSNGDESALFRRHRLFVSAGDLRSFGGRSRFDIGPYAKLPDPDFNRRGSAAAEL